MGKPVFLKLVNLIENNADELTQSYLQDVKQQPGMPTYRAWDEDEVCRRAYHVYSQLSKWISRETSKDELKKYWTSLGQQRRQEGFALSEIVQALQLIRKHLWLKIESEGLLDSAVELLMAIELYNHVLAFFDRAVIYTVLGYESGD